MAVDPEQIEEIVRATVELYRTTEAALLQLVTSYLAKGIDAPTWATERMAAVGQLRSAAQALLTQLAADGDPYMRQAVADAYREGNAAALTDFLPAGTAAALAAQEATAVVTQAPVVESLANALIHDVGLRHANVLRDVVDIYRKVVTQAVATSVAGGLTRRQASQIAYQRFIDRGVTGFTDRAGRRWRLSSYVEMAARTVIARAAVQGQTDRQQRLGLQLVMISNEAQECVLCRPYEGRVLRIDDGPIGKIQVAGMLGGQHLVDVKATIDDARARGFQHPNCRHSVRVYLPGVTRLPEQPTADPDGDEARQRQRAIERAIRRWKEREQGALTPEAKTQARARVRLWQSQMRDHLAANPKLKRLSYREQIGAGNLPGEPAKGIPKPKPTPAPAPAKPPALAAPKPTPRPEPKPEPKPQVKADAAPTTATDDRELTAKERERVMEVGLALTVKDLVSQGHDVNDVLKRLPFTPDEGLVKELERQGIRMPAGTKPPAPATRKPEPKRTAVPDSAKPFMRNVDGIEDLVAAVQRVDAKAARTKLSGGASAETDLVTTADGTKLVHKLGLDWGNPEEVAASVRRQADAEQLASLVGRTIGAPVVKTYRDGIDTVWMSFVEGKMISEVEDAENLIAGRAGKLLGFLDQLVGNTDRNPGNIMVNADGLVGIDHGWAWNRDRSSEFEAAVAGGPNRPAGHFAHQLDWKDNPLTASDVATVRERLTALAPDFELLGRRDWLDYSLQVLDDLSAHAKGTEDLIG